MIVVALFFAAAAAQQFDLDCRGTWRIGALTAPPEKHDFRLRIDLAAKKYCEDDCTGLLDIAEVKDTVINFRVTPPEYKVRDFASFALVDRTTGQYMEYEHDKLGTAAVDATCTPAPFSGFPKVETKF